MVRKSAHNKLNAKQLRTLGLIYRFRFITIPLLAQYKKIKHQSALEAITILEKQKLIGKRYSKTDKLLRKAARYYLATDGLKELKNQGGSDELILHAMYKNPNTSEGFIDRCLQAMELYIQLEQDYPDRFEIYTRVETTHIDGFLELPPDLYLKSTKSSKPSYFLELQAGNQPFVLKKRIDEYIESYDSDEWEQGDFPGTLVVCDSASSERTIQVYITKVLESTGIDDEIRFLTTTGQALGNRTLQVWTNALNPDKLLEL